MSQGWKLLREKMTSITHGGKHVVVLERKVCAGDEGEGDEVHT